MWTAAIRPAAPAEELPGPVPQDTQDARDTPFLAALVLGLLSLAMAALRRR